MAEAMKVTEDLANMLEESAKLVEEAAKPAAKAAGPNGGPAEPAADTVEGALRLAFEDADEETKVKRIPPHLSSLHLEMTETMIYTMKANIKYEVPARYELQTLCGNGAMGTVVQAEDLHTHEKVAIKKVPRVFDHQSMTLRILREVRTLRHLKHENLSLLKNIFFSGSKTTFNAIYLVMDYMEMDLAQVLKSEQPLTECHLKVLPYQILRGLKYMHSAHVIHRDLKPQNLLVNGNCDLKICDLGLVRVSFQPGPNIRPLTQYACTRWYRAPELLCAQTHYSDAIDIWSLGCIFAEMHTAHVLFRGTSTSDQLNLIIALLGSPAEADVRMIEHEKCRSWIRMLPGMEPVPMEKVFENMTELAQGFLLQMLCWGPKRRSSAAELLQDPYLEWLHMPEDEPSREPLDITEYEFEQRKVTPKVLREELFNETLHFYPELRDKLQREAIASGPEADISQCDLLLPGQHDDLYADDSVWL